MILKDNGINIWNGYLKEIRNDVVEKQKGIEATESDIELLGRMIWYVKNFAEITRNYGLLAMEEEAIDLDMENPAEESLKEAVQLITDGSSQDNIAEILSNGYWISDPKAYMAAAVYIGIRGALLISEGEHPYKVQNTVSSILHGKIREKCIEVSRNYQAKKQEKQEEVAKNYFETDFSRSESLEVRKALDLLEKELDWMSDAEIQRLLREVDNNYLIQALIGMKQKARLAIARNMSARLRGMIMVDCYQIADIEDCAIAEGAVYVMEKLRVLQGCGEIMDTEERLLYR